MEFNEMYWHDSIIKNIKIDRSNPGTNDIIQFEVDWYDNGKGSLIFEEVYWANLNLNFGIVAQESILDAFIAEESDSDLLSFHSKWHNSINEVSCYVINLNSTGGVIKIIARRFKVL